MLEHQSVGLQSLSCSRICKAANSHLVQSKGSDAQGFVKFYAIGINIAPIFLFYVWLKI